MKLEESLDTFIVIDGLPIVPEDSRQKLVKFLLRKLNAVGHTSEDAVFMPINDKKMSEGYVFFGGIQRLEDEWMKLTLARVLNLGLPSSSMRPPNRPSPRSSTCTVPRWIRSTPCP